MRYLDDKITYKLYDLDNVANFSSNQIFPTRYTNPLFNYSVFSVGLYTTEYSDTFQSIASKLYNDASQWWKIADLNPEYDPLDYLDALPDNITLKVIITD
jgi:hypothetical protein